MILSTTSTQAVVPDVDSLCFVEGVVLGLCNREEREEAVVTNEFLVELRSIAVILVDHLAICVHLPLDHFADFICDINESYDVANQRK